MRHSRTTAALCGLCCLLGCNPGQDDPTSGTPTGTATGATTGTATGTSMSDCDEVHNNRTVGLIKCRPEASPGYTLFTPNQSRTTYLIDIRGELVNQWETNYTPGESAYLLENGHLLRTAKDTSGTPFAAGGAGGRVEEFDWDGNLVWSFEYKSDAYLQHHDIEPMPSGNVLMIAWELKTEDEAIAAGRDPSTVNGAGVWANHIIEVDPSTDEIVWEWHVWDHLVQDHDPTKDNYGVVADHPGRVDLNLTGPGGGGGGGPGGGISPDWNHANGLDYNPTLDQIVISSHHQDEVWIIDHGLSTAEAAGPAGDLLYRWGNPQNYGAGTASDKQLSGQHDPTWIEDGRPGAGNLILFNNGVDWGYSSAFEFTTPVDADGSYALNTGDAYAPDGPAWSYDNPGEFYSSFISGVQRLPNGNTLICSGADGWFFEVTDAGEIVWEYINPVNGAGPVSQGTDPDMDHMTFRADRYPADYGAFDGKDLTPQGPIEL